MSADERVEEALRAFLATVARIVGKDPRQVLETLAEKIEEVRHGLLQSGTGWGSAPPRAIGALYATKLLFQPVRVRASIVRMTTPLHMVMPDGEQSVDSLLMQVHLRDERADEIAAMDVTAEWLVHKLRMLALERKQLEFLGRVVPVPRDVQGRTAELLLLIEDVRRVKTSLQMLDATGAEIAATERLLGDIEADGGTPFTYIVGELQRHIGIVGLEQHGALRLAVEFAVLQAMTVGRIGNAAGRLHGLLVGSPATGKKLVHTVARVLNPRFQEAHPSKVTVAGVCGATRPARGGFVSDPGLLDLADQGVFSVQDFHSVAKGPREQLFGAFSMLCEDGRVVDASAAQTAREASTALLIDLNRKRDLGRRSSGFHDDIGVPLNVLSRFDFVHVLPGDARMLAEVATMLLDQLARGGVGVGDGLLEDPWVRELRLLVAYLRDRVEPDLSPAAEDLVDRFLDLALENESSPTLAAFYTRLSVSVIKFTNAICRARAKPVADEDVVAEVYRFLAPKIELLRALDPSISVPRSWTKRERQAWMRAEFGGKTASADDIAAAYEEQTGHAVHYRTVMRDIDQIGAQRRGRGLYLLPAPEDDQ